MTQSHESWDVKYTRRQTGKAVDSPGVFRRRASLLKPWFSASETSNFKNSSGLNMKLSLQVSRSTIGSAMFRGSHSVRRLAYWVEGDHLG